VTKSIWWFSNDAIESLIQGYHHNVLILISSVVSLSISSEHYVPGFSLSFSSSNTHIILSFSQTSSETFLFLSSTHTHAHIRTFSASHSFSYTHTLSTFFLSYTHTLFPFSKCLSHCFLLSLFRGIFFQLICGSLKILPRIKQV